MVDNNVEWRNLGGKRVEWVELDKEFEIGILIELDKVSITERLNIWIVCIL